MKKHGLGRSLTAILSPSSARQNDGDPIKSESSAAIHSLAIGYLSPGAFQPRRDMDEDALHELAASIRAQGILQPILVRPLASDRYEILAGERRWRAAQKAGLHEVPVIIKDIPDETAMAIGLIENIQRENLNAIDEAFGLQRLAQEFSLTHQEIAMAIGRSRTAVSNLLRLLNLPVAVQQYLQHGDLEMGHARALLALPGPQQLPAAQHIVEKKWSVRETERYIKKIQQSPATPVLIPSIQSIDSEVSVWQKTLSAQLGVPVKIQSNAQGAGKMVIAYRSTDDLKKLFQRLHNA